MARAPERLAWLAVAGATLLLAGLAIGPERRIARVAATRDGDAATRTALLAEAADWRPADVPPRAAAGLAALWLRQAATAVPAGSDRAALAQAQAMLARADAGGPRAAALLLHSQLALGSGPHPSRTSLAAFIASYAAAPFLTAEGFWRSAYAARYWRDLPPATQEAAVAEATWLGTLDGRFADRLADIMAGSPMAVRVALRMPKPKR